MREWWVPVVFQHTSLVFISIRPQKNFQCLAGSNRNSLQENTQCCELLDLVEDKGIKLPADLSRLDEFTPFAVKYRYRDMVDEQQEIIDEQEVE